MSIVFHFFFSSFVLSKINIPFDPQNMIISTIKTESGLEYFNIYNVVAVDYNGVYHVIHSHRTKEAAEENKAFCSEAYKELYRSFFVDELIVWAD